MSYTELFGVQKNGDVIPIAKYKNAHGGAAFVWTSLAKKYEIDGPLIAFRPGERSRWENLWDWAKANPDRLRAWEWNTLLSTYDNVVVTDLDLLADSLVRFEDALANGIHVCHLALQARELRLLAAEGYRGAAWNQTSVNADYIWCIYDEVTDEQRSYNIDRADQHWIAELRPLEVEE